MAILTGYFDESYSHPPKPLMYTIGGYISEDWRWKRFEIQWASALSDEGIEYFHMIDLAHKKGVYASWLDEKRKKFLKKLHYIIHDNTIIDFASSVVVADYDEMIPPSNTNLRMGFGEPHVFAVIGCMKHIHDWAKDARIRDRINYVFEQGTIHDTTVRAVFGGMDANQAEHYRSKGCAFYDKRDVASLQAADILAYENMLEMRRRVDPSNTRPIRASAVNLNRPESVWAYYDKEHFTEILENAEKKGLIYQTLPRSTPEQSN